MKKNFLAIVSLLIAAMLLVISCSQEVAPVDNGLVNVTLSTSVSGKALEVTGGAEGTISYSYIVTPQWEDDGVDRIVGPEGEKNIGTSLGGNISLGYMSQGLWRIYVKGVRNNKIVLEGTTDAYIAKDSSNVVVFLKARTGENTATLSFDIDVNDLENGGSDHKVLYSIVGTGTVYVNNVGTFNHNGELSRGTASNTVGDNNHESVSKSATYALPSETEITLSPGYYRVTVSLKETKENGVVVGGITRGFLVLNDDTELEVGGYVTAADFVNGSLNIIRPEVSVVSLTAVEKNSNDPISEDVYTITGENNSVTVVFTATPTSTTTNESSPVTGSPYSYVWSIDGVEDVTTNSPTKEVTFAPGLRHVTCTVYRTYSFDNGITTYQETVASSAYFDFKINK